MQLIALAKDQVNLCLERDIEAELWNGAVSAGRLAAIRRDWRSSECAAQAAAPCMAQAA